MTVPNAALFDILSKSDPVAMKAAEAINAYIRSQLTLRFTQLPRRGLFRTMFRSQTLLTKAQCIRLGIPDGELTSRPTCAGGRCRPQQHDGQTYYRWEYDDGQLFYEYRERQLDREDYERRLAARQVPKHEWYSRERTQRKMQQLNLTITPRDIEAKFYEVMGELAAVIAGIGK